tara:strand:- start:1164 stop:2063 length:900 start_codon:yes stop_codon:yes gene_type:complete
MENLISMRNLGVDKINSFLKLAENLEKGKVRADMNGKVMGALFFEPSTRTQLSFETAMKRLGGEVITMSGTKGTSLEKGETLSDTVKIINQYSDIIVMRHPMEGAAKYVSECVDIPVVNAGDGANQHPTQSLLDLYSIYKTQDSMKNLKVCMLGDLRYGRTVHSLSFALGEFNPEFYFVSPDILQMPKYILDELDQLKIKYTQTQNLDKIVKDLDILYVTRIQKERFTDPQDYEKVKSSYVITPEILKGVKKNFKILHPLPRVDEISVEVDNLDCAYYFQQAKNGVYMRQAIITKLMEG